jgi:hypothetical protein
MNWQNKKKMVQIWTRNWKFAVNKTWNRLGVTKDRKRLGVGQIIKATPLKSHIFRVILCTCIDIYMMSCSIRTYSIPDGLWQDKSAPNEGALKITWWPNNIDLYKIYMVRSLLTLLSPEKIAQDNNLYCYMVITRHQVITSSVKLESRSSCSMGWFWVVPHEAAWRSSEQSGERPEKIITVYKQISCCQNTVVYGLMPFWFRCHFTLEFWRAA